MLSAVFAIAIGQQQTAQIISVSQLRDVPTEQVVERAEFHFARSDWKSSSFAYQVLIERSPRNSTYRFRYGKTLVELTQYNNAISPLRFARDAQFNLGETNFLLSRAYAGLKMDDIALTYLDEAVDKDFEDIAATNESPEFTRLKDNKHFQQLLEKIEFPAVKKPGGRILDFLVGTWTYNTDDGLPAGQSTVIKTEKGYQVKEVWANPDGEQTTTNFQLQVKEAKWSYLFDSTDGRKGKGEIKIIPNGIERIGIVWYPDGGLQYIKEALVRNPDSTITISTMHSYDDGETWTEIAHGTLALVAAPKPTPRSGAAVAAAVAPVSPKSATSPGKSVIITIGE